MILAACLWVQMSAMLPNCYNNTSWISLLKANNRVIDWFLLLSYFSRTTFSWYEKRCPSFFYLIHNVLIVRNSKISFITFFLPCQDIVPFSLATHILCCLEGFGFFLKRHSLMSVWSLINCLMHHKTLGFQKRSQGALRGGADGGAKQNSFKRLAAATYDRRQLTRSARFRCS